MIALAALLVVQDVQTGDAWIPHLRYLARHQAADGSWGARPAGCTCPEPAPPAKADPAALLLQLGHDEVARRDAAERELRALGDSALPALRAGAEHTDPEIRARCARVIERLATRCTGVSDLETSALAVLAFLGDGYSHLSRDTYEDLCYGTAVKRGLQWLIARQDADGFFDRKDAPGNAVAALALSEAYGATGSALYKEPAQKGVSAIGRTPGGDPRDLAWKALLLISARDSELEGDFAGQAAAMADLLKESGSPLALAARARFKGSFQREPDPAAVETLAGLEPKALHPELRYFSTLALLSLEGSGWKRWNPRFKDSLLPLPTRGVAPCERGAREGEDLRGRLRATALHQLSFQIYTRPWRGPFVPAKK